MSRENLTVLQLKLLSYGYAPGDYMGVCHMCNQEVMNVDKRAVVCETCACKRYISALERCILDLEDDMERGAEPL